MTPTPQENVSIAATTDATETTPSVAVDEMGPALDGESIVISGISGVYPQSDNVKQLSDILYNKENPVTSEGIRWTYKHPELPPACGMAPGLDLFDAQFFAVHYRLGHYIDPMSRKGLEHAYQAIYDAGMSPAQFNGKKVAVFIGSAFSDCEKLGMADFVCKSGLGLLGMNKTMFANRISYWLNTKGPSVGIDELDCSSTTALEAAYSAMRRGECEAAIVGGASLVLHPHGPLFHARISGTASDGNTKSFSQDANGYTVSDTVSTLLLQKAKHAKRVYAELLYVKNEFVSIVSNEGGPKFGYFRNPQTTAAFIRNFYKDIQVAPQAVEYVEAYGTGVPDADKSELEAIEEVYCKDRQDPLLVGSVTSNIGLTEAASGMAALTKVLLGYNTGKLAANLHCDNPRQDVAALREGRMRIVTEHQLFNRTYVAINGMSLTGVNSHVLLHGRYKPKDLTRYQSAIPRLVTLSGRQESAVTKITEDLKYRPIDAEEIALFHNIHVNNISGHLGRGYVILDTDENNKTVSLREKIGYCDNARRPLWFVFSGMGSQWAGMGTQLMRIPIFAAAIERCQKVLGAQGLDIVHIITSPDKAIFENIQNSFVGIAAIQIGLTDILHELGLKPNGIIGHSVGELVGAYADGYLTAEETILCAFYRGQVSLNTPMIQGSMAAVGLGYEQVSKLCPPEIDVACHNGPDSCTISGPADVMKTFVAELTANGVFAKEVPTSNIAYHSRYISVAGPQLLNLLKNVIRNPKLRSERWLSTSVPQNQWNEDLAKFCSAEYQINNLLSPVLFEETSRLIPSDAVCVEVAPHGLLQAILKRSMSADSRHVPLTRRGHPDNALFLLEAIGETITILSNKTKRSAAACQFLKSIHDDELSYLRGHVVREKRCYPFAAALVAVWDTLAMHSGSPKRQIPVKFSNVHLYAQPVLHDQRPLRLSVALQIGSGKFEILNENSKVASGYCIMDSEKNITHNNDTDMVLSSKDIYQLLQDRDYNYRCGGVTIKDIKYHNLPPVSQDSNRVDLVISPAQATSANISSAVVQRQDGINNVVTLQCSRIGDLDSLRWVEAAPIRPSNLAVTVHYTGLCTLDVKRAIGVVPCDTSLYGMDYSGTTNSGERVMGLVHSGAAGSVVRAQPELLWPVPAHWSLEDAATVPLAYTQALYCLIIKGRMLPEHDVLIHGGTGALGQAAIAVALAYGCRVFTTVSDSRKKEFLKKLYPELKDEHIGSSRDVNLSDMILIATKGKGCEVVLNCVKGPFKSTTLKCIAFSGILVDTDKLQDGEDYELGMNFMTKQRS
ncbi:hypothetical protein PYW07_008657 [Mythimna separata]|uniref:Ketosynthase family 3 (KS3) domain-containing protein n=1 Tax=Mythimna separata TaxID=271217 RepID=A0AAD7YD60_MYTSE|nr:hypothetical protein PYW07_008657 [Mythimna separata]